MNPRLPLVLLLLVLMALPASAQRRWERHRWQPERSTSRGFFVEGGLQALQLNVDTDGRDETQASGGGLGVRLGYGFTRTVAVYLALQGASMEDEDDASFTLGHADLGVQFSLARPSQALVPYLNVALTGVTAEFEDPFDAVNVAGDVRYTGGGLTLGGGVRYHFSPGLAFNAGLEGYGGQFTEVTFDGEDTDVTTDLDEDVNLSGARLRIGLTWFPGAGRRHR